MLLWLNFLLSSLTNILARKMHTNSDYSLSQKKLDYLYYYIISIRITNNIGRWIVSIGWLTLICFDSESLWCHTNRWIWKSYGYYFRDSRRRLETTTGSCMRTWQLLWDPPPHHVPVTSTRFSPGCAEQRESSIYLFCWERHSYSRIQIKGTCTVQIRDTHNHHRYSRHSCPTN